MSTTSRSPARRRTIRRARPMTPAARLQAAIEILDEVIASARDDGPPADTIVTRYFKHAALRRFGRSAGGARAGVPRDPALGRAPGERTGSGPRLAEDEPVLLELFGLPRGPEPRADGEAASPARLVPKWLVPELSAFVHRTNGRLCSSARRSIFESMSRAQAATTSGANSRWREPTPLSPWGIRLPPTRGSTTIPLSRRAGRGAGRGQPVDRAGVRAARTASGPRSVRRRRRQVARARRGGAWRARSSLPTATARGCRSCRRARSGPARRSRQGCLTRPASSPSLPMWRGKADLVLVDAPCSGSGTWRRNPEGRWRLTPERLERVIGAPAAPARHRAPSWSGPAAGWSMRSARSCPAKGQGRLTAFSPAIHRGLGRRRPLPRGRLDGAGRLLTPGHDGTDGFFVARLGRPC